MRDFKFLSTITFLCDKYKIDVGTLPCMQGISQDIYRNIDYTSSVLLILKDA